jgi:hypothetical protein
MVPANLQNDIVILIILVAFKIYLDHFILTFEIANITFSENQHLN